MTDRRQGGRRHSKRMHIKDTPLRRGTKNRRQNIADRRRSNRGPDARQIRTYREDD